MYYTENDFRLYHHGIKGMKWGIRRYQNPDGSLTDEGRKRYGSGRGYEESFKRRAKRAMNAAKYEDRADRIKKKADKAYAKGKDEKAEKFMAKYEKFQNLRMDMIDGLTDNEVKAGRQFFQDQQTVQRLSTPIIIATGGGAIPAVAASLAIGTAISLTPEHREATKLYKEEKAKYEAEQSSYRKRIKEKDEEAAIREQYEVDTKRARSAKTDEEHDRLQRAADERRDAAYKALEKSKAQKPVTSEKKPTKVGDLPEREKQKVYRAAVHELNKELADRESQKNAQMSVARSKGKFDDDFMKQVRNNPKQKDKKWMTEEYSKYLDKKYLINDIKQGITDMGGTVQKPSTATVYSDWNDLRKELERDLR